MKTIRSTVAMASAAGSGGERGCLSDARTEVGDVLRAVQARVAGRNEVTKRAGECCSTAPRLGIAGLCCLALLLSACAGPISFIADTVVGAAKLTGAVVGAVIPGGGDSKAEKRLLKKLERECLERGQAWVSRSQNGKKYLDCVAADEAVE